MPADGRVESAEFKGAVSFEAKKAYFSEKGLWWVVILTPIEKSWWAVLQTSRCASTIPKNTANHRIRNSGLKHTARLQKGP